MKRILSFLFLVTVAALSLQAAVENKTYSKSSTSASRVLVDNRYGSIQVQHWNKNSAEINVIVSVTASSESRAKEIMNKISIVQKEEGDQLSSITTTAGVNTSGGEKIEIKCMVNLPSSFAMNLTQKYGSITMPPTPTNADAVIDVKYGSLNGGSFNQGLTLIGGYSNITLDRVNLANMEIKYCKPVKITSAKEVTLEAKYSDFNIQQIDGLKGELSYSEVDIASIKRLEMNVRYSGFKINEVLESVKLSGMSYSNLKIEKLSPRFSLISTTDIRYSNVKITMDGTPAVRFESNPDKYSTVKISNAIKSRATSASNAPTIEFSGRYSSLDVK